MNTTTVTTDLTMFGHRELEILTELIGAIISQGLPRDFYDDEVHPAYNEDSGKVFLTNSKNQVAMLDDDGNLKLWYRLQYSGNEGFLDDLIDQYKDDYIRQEDWDELADICHDNGYDDMAYEIRERIEGDVNYGI